MGVRHTHSPRLSKKPYAPKPRRRAELVADYERRAERLEASAKSMQEQAYRFWAAAQALREAAR